MHHWTEQEPCWQHHPRRGHRPPWAGPGGGPPPWVGQFLGGQFGGPFGGGPGGPRGGRPRVRRGDVRSAILDVLGAAEEPINGYQVIQQISERSHGLWKPSPGSVYPTIAQLQDEGLVEDAPTGRKALVLSDEGRAWVADHGEELDGVWAGFEEAAGDEEAVGFRQVVGQTVAAVVQVMQTGSADQREQAVSILADTRRRLYGLLAEGPEEDLDDGRGEGEVP